MSKKVFVRSIICNWYATDEVGEDYTIHTVGKLKVVSIEYVVAEDGMPQYAAIAYEDGTVTREFNINAITSFNAEERIAMEQGNG